LNSHLNARIVKEPRVCK